jgi:hypothetical protein
MSNLTFLSNYHAVHLNISLNTQLTLREPTTYKNFEKTNWNNFQRDISNFVLLSIGLPPSNANLRNTQINLYIEKLSDAINSIADKHATVIKQSNRKFGNMLQDTKNLIIVKKMWQYQQKQMFHRHLNRLISGYQSISSFKRFQFILIKNFKIWLG